MINLKQAQAKRIGMAERAAALMELHFPQFPEAWLWRRGATKGFTTIPRTLPIAMEAIDEQSKGQPAGHTLFCLWARTPDGPLVVVENPATFAAEAGFSGARAVDTWRRRMKFLRDNLFILPKKGPSGDFHYVLLLNPNAAVEWMRSHGKVQNELYGRFRDRVAEVGASGELDAIWEHWNAEAAAKAAAEAEAEAAAEVEVVEVVEVAEAEAPKEASTAVPTPPPNPDANPNPAN
jgi:hypothetical protein